MISWHDIVMHDNIMTTRWWYRATTTYICRFHAMIHHIADIIAWHLICQYHGMTTTLISWHDITDDILAISWQYHNDIMVLTTITITMILRYATWDTKIGYQKIPDTMQQNRMTHTQINRQLNQRVDPKWVSKWKLISILIASADFPMQASWWRKKLM